MGFAVHSVVAETSQFSADMAMGLQGQTAKGTIHVTGTHYRMDLDQDGKNITIIVDRDAGLTRILLYELKQYIEMKSDDPASLMNDPFHDLMYTESMKSAFPLK
jgi:hypothetical protein